MSLAIVGLVFALTTRAASGQEVGTATTEAPPAAGAPVSPTPCRRGDRGVFRLAQGGTIAGEILARDEAADVVRLVSGQEVRLPAGSLVERMGDYEEARPAARPGPARVRVFLRDGRTVEGQLLARSPDGVRVLLDADGRVEDLPRSSIREVYEFSTLEVNRGGQPDPARLRHVHAASALGPAPRELVLMATSEGLELRYGATGWLSGVAALSTPYLDGSRFVTPSVVVGADARSSLVGWLHVSVGVRGFVDGTGTTLFATASATAVSRHAQATLFAGPPVAGVGRFGAFDGATAGLAVTSRISARFAVVLEAWSAVRDSPGLAGAGSVRFIAARRWAVEAGAMGSAQTAVPWMALTWRSSDGEAP